MISCICPTYDRVSHDMPMLEETVYWFLQQKHKDKELLIFNDAKDQTLICDAPQVKVFNIYWRFPTLGDKYNAMISIAKGDIICPWEDDDISLPNRLTTVAWQLRDSIYYKPKCAYFQNGKAPTITECSRGNVFHNASGYRKGKVVEYRSVSGPQDMYFDIDNLANCKSVEVPYNYVYRWQAGSGHQCNLSGYSDTESAYNNRPKPVPGVYTINPRMYYDYGTFAGVNRGIVASV